MVKLYAKKYREGMSEEHQAYTSKTSIQYCNISMYFQKDLMTQVATSLLATLEG